MRVAFDVGPLLEQPTGVGIFTHSLATALAGILTSDELVLIGRRDGSTDLPSGIASRSIAGRRYISWLQAAAARDVAAAGASIGHFSDGLVPFRRQVRTVVSIHDMSLVRAWRTHPARRLLRVPLAVIAPHLADLVIVPSRATADEVKRLTRVPAQRIEVVPYAARPDLAPADDREVAHALSKYKLVRDRYILALGTIEPRKNHVRLLAAFELAVRRGSISSDMVLVIAGHAGWHAAPIIERIETSSQKDQIRRLGYVDSVDLPSLLTGAAAVAYPSLYEGFGLPVVEAMACGAAVVTSSTSSMPEVAGDAAFLVDPMNVGDIARGLDEALQAAASDRNVVAARAVAQAARFSWQKTATQVVELYRALG